MTMAAEPRAQSATESAVSYVVTIQEHVVKLQDLVHENLHDA